jgi:hypothetical protein
MSLRPPDRRPSGRSGLHLAGVGLSAALLAGGLACGGGGGGGGSDGPAYRCEDSAVGGDTVAVVCAQRTAKDVWRLRLVVGGPTTSQDIMGFNFDLVFDPSVLSYVEGSATLGTFLSIGGDNPMMAAALSSSDAGRLIVGAHRTHQLFGVGAGTGPETILELSIRANMLTAVSPALLRFENAEAVDSSGDAIGSIHFSDQLLLSVE